MFQHYKDCIHGKDLHFCLKAGNPLHFLGEILVSEALGEISISLH